MSNIFEKIKVKASNKQIVKLVILNLIFNALFLRIAYVLVLLHSKKLLEEEKITVGEFIIYNHTIYAYYVLSTLVFFVLLKMPVKDKFLLIFFNIILIRQTHLNSIIADAIKWDVGNWYLTALSFLLLASMIFILRTDNSKRNNWNNDIVLDEEMQTKQK